MQSDVMMDNVSDCISGRKDTFLMRQDQEIVLGDFCNILLRKCKLKLGQWRVWREWRGRKGSAVGQELIID